MKKAATVIAIDQARPEQAFSRCRDVVASGGVIAYPTDTFYGIGVDPFDGTAVKRLFEIKGRQADQPILLLIADSNNTREWALEVPPCATELMERYWPGPLTLIFRAKRNILPALTAGTGTIGLRVPGNALTRGLLRYVGHALTGTSANLAGQPSPHTAQETAGAVGSLVDLILDGGETAGGKPSTVVDVSTDKPWVVREGAIPWLDILARR